MLSSKVCLAGISHLRSLFSTRQKLGTQNQDSKEQYPASPFPAEEVENEGWHDPLILTQAGNNSPLHEAVKPLQNPTGHQSFQSPCPFHLKALGPLLLSMRELQGPISASRESEFHLSPALSAGHPEVEALLELKSRCWRRVMACQDLGHHWDGSK